MKNTLSACTSACLCAVMVGSCATSAPTAAPPPDPTQAFLQEVISRLPGDNVQAEMANAPREEFYLWGSETCAQLKAGRPEKLVTDSLAEFFGPTLAGALVGSAKETLCPDFRPHVRAGHPTPPGKA